MEQLCSSSGTTLECGVTSSCCLASGLLEVLLLHVPTYSVMLWYIQCHRSTGDQPRNYRTGRGKLAFTLETSDNCFAPTIPDLREAFELAHFASPFPGFRIQSLDQTCQVTLGILVYQELLSLQTCTCMCLHVPGYIRIHGHTQHMKLPGCVTLLEMFTFLGKDLKFRWWRFLCPCNSSPLPSFCLLLLKSLWALVWM